MKDLVKSIIVLAGISILFTCKHKDPFSPETGLIILELKFADQESSAPMKTAAIAFDSLQVRIINSNKDTLINQSLVKSGNTFKGQFEVPTGSDYRVEVEYYEKSILVYSGITEGVTVSGGAPIIVSVTLAHTFKSINILPDSFQIEHGQTQQLTVWSVNKNDKQMDVTTESDLIVSPPQAGVVNSSGLFMASSNWTGTGQIIATYKNMTDSTEVTVGNVVIDTVSMPVFNPGPDSYEDSINVKITCTTEGAKIYYTTNGSDPTESDSLYKGPVTVSTTLMLKAKAFKSGLVASDITSGIYTIVPKIETPAFDPVPGAYDKAQSITITCATSDVTIYYTTNGSVPTESGALYSAPITISSATTLEAKAYKTGYKSSDVASGTYSIKDTVETPTFDPVGGTYDSSQTITISCTTDGSTIYYTTNGEDPTESDSVYTDAITITDTTTLKAKAFKTDWTASEVASATYIIKPTVSTPHFDLAESSYYTTQTVEISCATEGAAIHYTTNGDDPTESDSIFTKALKISSTTTLKARAFKTDWNPSDIVTAIYKIIEHVVASPTFNPSGGAYTTEQSVTISCSTSETNIYYTTDGSTPDESDTKYMSAIIIPLNTTLTIKARAFRSGWTSSSVDSATYKVTGTVKTPTFAPSEGTYTSAQDVTISCATAGATIHYTTDGSTPDQSDTEYTSAIHVPLNSSMTIKAKAYKTDWTSSSVASAAYTLTDTVATPTFNPSGGAYTTAQNVTISCSTSETNIYYTTDGSTPDESDTKYMSAIIIPLNTTRTIKARAFRSGWTSSSVDSATYKVTGTVKTPTFAPSEGTYISAQDVTISCATAGATIHYTTDGSTPDQSDTEYASAINVPLNSSMTIKAKAYKTDWESSVVASAAYTVTDRVATPTFNPGPGTYNDAQSVTISCSTLGAAIYYTTDGSAPSVSDIEYTTAVDVSTTTTIKAKAFKTDWASSSEASGTYTINTAPNPSFTVDPTSGTTETIFSFNASGCSDSEDATSALQVLWDWENDGTYDTDYTTTKTESHQYATTGTKTVKLKVMDTGGFTDSTTIAITVSYPTCAIVTDIDGNVYKTVKIGNQCWMAENLKVTKYRNGDAIHNITDDTEWSGLSTGAYCYYAHNSSYNSTYGKLYNWYAVADSDNIAPAGWHVASDSDWQILVDYLGGNSIAGNKLKSKENWDGTEEYGFSGLPGGFRRTEGIFEGMGSTAHFFSSTGHTAGAGGYWVLNTGFSTVYHADITKRYGLSVRCVKD